MNSTLHFLIEIRKRLLHVFSVFGLLFVGFFLFSNYVFHWYIFPLQHILPKNTFFIATQMTTPLLTPLSIATNLAILSTIPYALFQIWRFFSPALYSSEQKSLRFILCFSVILFIIGNIFCYFFILPFMFECILQALPKGVVFLPDMGSAAHFITWMMIVFGLSFQIPLVCILLIQGQWLEVRQLINARPYVIVAAFVIGMLLTPPDVLSQILLAIPLWGLYELGVGIARMITKKRDALTSSSLS